MIVTVIYKNVVEDEADRESTLSTEAIEKSMRVAWVS